LFPLSAHSELHPAASRNACIPQTAVSSSCRYHNAELCNKALGECMTDIATMRGWDTPYGHAMLKLDRAKHHIDEFDDRLFTSSDRHGPSLHVDGNDVL